MRLKKATVREIAREAGCATGALGHHFRNCDALINGGIDLLAHDFFGETDHEWEATSLDVAQIRMLVSQLALNERYQRDRTLMIFRLWSRAANHTPTAQALRKYHHRLFTLIVTLIEEAQ